MALKPKTVFLIFQMDCGIFLRICTLIIVEKDLLRKGSSRTSVMQYMLVIESKLSISIIGFDLELGEFCHDFHSISIPINHSGTHFNFPAISTSLK